MTINDCVKRVKLITHRGDPTITNDQITTDILVCLDMAWKDIAQLLPRQAFRADGVDIVTVAGTEIYSLAGNTYPVQELVMIHYIFNNVNYNMKKVESEREFWGQYYYKSAAQNRPFVYCPWGFDTNHVKQIRMFPIPDQAYTINYTYLIDPTVVEINASLLSNEVPFFPSYLQEAVWKGGVYYYLKSYDDAGQQAAMLDYEKAKTRQDISEDADMDSELQFRFDTQRTRFIDPITGIRLQ